MNEIDIKQTELAKDRDLFYKLEKQRLEIIEQEQSIRVKLLKTMEYHGITKLENDNIAITRVDETTREDLDKTKLKKDLPEIYNKYIKITPIKSSLRIRLK